MKTITSANSVFTLAIGDIFGAPIQLEGYTADDCFTAESYAPTDIVMGVDGHQSQGFTFSSKKMGIKLMPTSKSVAVFDAWNSAMETTRDAYAANAEIVFPGTGQKFICTNGALTKYSVMPGAKKTLQPLEYEITWERIIPMPL